MSNKASQGVLFWENNNLKAQKLIHTPDTLNTKLKFCTKFTANYTSITQYLNKHTNTHILLDHSLFTECKAPGSAKHTLTPQQDQ